jgi:hypothetical protein
LLQTFAAIVTISRQHDIDIRKEVIVTFNIRLSCDFLPSPSLATSLSLAPASEILPATVLLPQARHSSAMGTKRTIPLEGETRSMDSMCFCSTAVLRLLVAGWISEGRAVMVKEETLVMQEGDDSRGRIAIVSCGKLVGKGDEKVLLVFNLAF